MTRGSKADADGALRALAALRLRLDDCDNPFSAHLDADRQTELLRSLAAQGDGVLPAIDRALGSGQPALRREAVALLGRLSPTSAVVTALVRALRHADPEVRRWALDRLRAHGDPALYGEGASLLEDASPVVARLAVDVVFSLDPVRALVDAAPLATHPASDVRATLALQLRTFGGVAELPQLDALTGDPDPRVRGMAIAGLVRISAVAARHSLVARYRDAADPLVREDALAALAGFAVERTRGRAALLSEVGAPLSAGLHGAPADLRRLVVIGLAGAERRDEVVRALDGPEGAFSSSAGQDLLRRLAAASDLEWVRELVEAAVIPRGQALDAARRGLASEDEATVSQAVRLAGTLGDPALAPAVVGARVGRRGEAELRRALSAMGAAAVPSMVGALVAASEPAERLAALRRLLECDIAGTSAHLAAALLDRRTLRRDRLLGPLERIGDAEAARALRAVALDAGDPLAEAAALAAASTGDRTVVPVLEALVGGLDERTAASALGALVRLGAVTGRVVGAVVAWSASTEHPPMQLAVVRATEGLRDPRLRRAVQRLAREGQVPLVRSEAARVLDVLGWRGPE